MKQSAFAKFWLLAVAFFVLSACSDVSSEPTLDLSNESAFEASVEEVMQSLDEQSQTEFSDALSLIMFDELMAGTSAGMPEEEIEQAIYQRLHGKTGEQVIQDMEENL
ncbi:hypothetical protein CWE12_10020 [Aliidiomarina sedimenti]|uniref:Peptidylprolyl isomerase n=1 Tax=Aliidiomarina sedimenti TaxID=1933879 RepID=A0ABY0BY21_9GAMM|nr:DUF6694 family lipoprotein [Aliidiomarina sedimenti]RUO29309.1 hypothetical protein CWE12_10020 [Aliidiomarina sedimenti]